MSTTEKLKENKMKKLSILYLTLFTSACTLDLDVVVPEQTTSDSTTSTTSPNEPTIITTSDASASMDMGMTSTTNSESTTGDPVKPCNERNSVFCDPGFVCISPSDADKGQCVRPCINNCENDLSCEQWTAYSEPQLPSGVGVCLPLGYCFLIENFPSNCVATETCIGEETELIGKCVPTCFDFCGGDEMCSDWKGFSNPPLPENIGVCL